MYVNRMIYLTAVKGGKCENIGKCQGTVLKIRERDTIYYTRKNGEKNEKKKFEKIKNKERIYYSSSISYTDILRYDTAVHKTTSK